MIILNTQLIHGKSHHHNVNIDIILEPKPYLPYGNISSAYKTDFPGHKPQMR